MIRRSTLRNLFTLAVAALLSVPAVGWGASPTYYAGQIIIKYKNGTPASQRQALRGSLGASQMKDLGIINAELVKLKSGMTVEQGMALAKKNPAVVYAEPDYELHALDLQKSPLVDFVPNDPLFNQLYGMTKISAPQAWDVFTGSPSVLVGVIDTGIDYNHPDLVANAWVNPGEIPGNSLDDDSNGFVDDVHGYDFVNNDGDPFDDHFHGTHCSGTIGGVGNNGVGVVGVNWNVKIAGIKFLDSGGSGSTANAISSVQYAVTIGCRLTSNSWGGGGFSQALKDAIDAAGVAGQLFVAAAGNAGSNIDASPSYPASYASANIVSVAATDQNDALASFSNYGLTSVDLGAPGVDILSCQPGAQYQLLSGTSMATPHVAGACAMVWGRFPGMTYAQVKTRIMDFADPVPALAGRCITGARLNVFMAIADPDSIAPGAVGDLATSNAGSTTMDLSWTETGDDGNVGRASRTELRYSTAPLTEGDFATGTLVPTPNPQPAGTAAAASVSGLAYSTTFYFAIKAFDEFGNAGAISNIATGTTLGAPALSTSSISLVTLDPNQSADQNLTLSNTGAGTLDWSISQPAIQSAIAEIVRKAQRPAGENHLDLAKGQADPRHGDPVVAATGGPDAFGYRWSDSDEPGGPAFAWVDITGVGTPIAFTGDDQNIASLPIGFSFPFYGNAFSTVNACTNGWLSFTSTLTSFTNQSLPTAAGQPENLVAPFWDDLTFSATGDAYYYNDGSRFIVSWVNAPHFSAGGPYTFQVILYPSGEIRFQYLTLTSPLDSATLGIQNDTRTIALQQVFNAAYAHNGLAVKITKIPQWLTVAPTSGRVLGGQSTNVNLHYESAGLLGGMHDALVSVLTNAPANGSLPAQLLVTGVPDITAGPASTDFGLVFVGYNQTRTLAVGNNGTGQLNVSNITSGDAQVGASPTAFSLAPGASQNVTLTYTPTGPGALASTVTVVSDDPDEGNTVLGVVGSANDAPDIATSQSSMGAQMLTNSSETQVLRVRNAASLTAANLDISLNASVSKASTRTPEIIPMRELGKDEADNRTGMPVLAGSGGPDAFGYKWKDSDAPGGPTFSWVEISGVGTQIGLNGDDQNVPTLPIGFSFPFYGSNFTTFNICSNGWVSFSSTATAFSNVAVPTGGTTAPNNLVAPFWDDLDFRPATSPNSRAYYYNDGSRLIIEYKDVPHYNGGGTTPGGPYTFQVLLYPSGKIVYQYLQMPLLLDSATIGIQDATRAIGLQMVFNAAYVHNNLAIQIQKLPEWLSVTPTNSSITGQQFTDLNVTYNSTDLPPGTYLGNLRISSNDPGTPVLNIPVTLHVITPTDTESRLPAAFALSMAGSNPSSGSPRFMMAIPKTSDVDIRVYNVKGSVVRELAHRAVQPGFHPLGWDGLDANGARVSSGVYFVRMKAGTYNKTLRVTLMH